MSKKVTTEVSGSVTPAFEAVRKAFIENFERRGELGAACCVYHRGEKVVDLWGGIRNIDTGEPWKEDTMVVVFSTTKGLSGLALALANSRGLLDYDERVCTYWPEFAAQGKDAITVRQLLAHQAALFAFDAPIDRSLVADLDRLAVVMAQEKPAWKPGTRQAYHAFSLGFYEGELLRRVDPEHRSLGLFFADEIATPLGLDFYIRLPEAIPNSRLATIKRVNRARALVEVGSVPMLLASMNKRSPLHRSMFVNPGPWLAMDVETVYARNLEIPSGGGVGTARAIARAYGVFATGGADVKLRPETLDALMASAVPPRDGFHDECLKREVEFSLGFMKSCRSFPYGSPAAFGASGAGGSFAFADPASGVGYAYVMNRMSARQGGDPRDAAIRSALRRSLAALA